MKDARDIRLLGIGFIAGMLCFYFFTLSDLSPPKQQTQPMIVAPARATAQARPLLRPVEFIEWKPGEIRATPRDRLQPEQLNYDLLDLKYVPDFQLPAN